MRGFFISFCWLFFGLGFVFAQTDALMDALEQEGLQNLRVVQEPGHVYLVYENNRFRYEAQAMAFVLDQVAEHAGAMEGTERSEVHLLVLQRGVPMMVLHTGFEALVALVDGSSSYADWVAQAEFSFEVEQVHRKRLMQRKVVLQLDVDADFPGDLSQGRGRLLLLRTARGEFDDPAFNQRAKQLPAAPAQEVFPVRGFMAVADQALQVAAAVARTAEHEQQHPVGEGKA